MLAVKFLTREWTPRNQDLYLLVASIRDIIKSNKLKVSFKWVSRDENKAADEIGRQVREVGKNIELWAN